MVNLRRHLPSSSVKYAADGLAHRFCSVAGSLAKIDTVMTFLVHDVKIDPGGGSGRPHDGAAVQLSVHQR